MPYKKAKIDIATNSIRNRGGRGGARNGIDEYIIRELPSELSNEMPIIKRQRVILK